MAKKASPSCSARLTDTERNRLMTLLASVSSHTLLNVLLDMNEDNADGSLIIEVLLERLAARHADNGVSAPS